MTLELISQDLRNLPSQDRGIYEENRDALVRRWQLVTSGELAELKNQDRWFPGQRHLFDVLSVLELQDVQNLADCSMPIFTMRLPASSLDKPPYHPPTNQFESVCVNELVMALIDRQRALYLNPTLSCALYDLTVQQGLYITQLATRDIFAVATDPMLVMEPVVADEFFTIAAVRKLTRLDRTYLATTSRKAKNF